MLIQQAEERRSLQKYLYSAQSCVNSTSVKGYMLAFCLIRDNIESCSLMWSLNSQYRYADLWREHLAMTQKQDGTHRAYRLTLLQRSA